MAAALIVSAFIINGLRPRVASARRNAAAFVIANLGFLAADVYIAHWVNAFERSEEWIPIGFSIVAARLWRALGTIVGWSALVVGVAGMIAAQLEGWAAIRDGRHTLIAAPTGSGNSRRACADLSPTRPTRRRGGASSSFRTSPRPPRSTPLSALPPGLQLRHDERREIREPRAHPPADFGRAHRRRERGEEHRDHQRGGDLDDRAPAPQKKFHGDEPIVVTAEGGRCYPFDFSYRLYAAPYAHHRHAPRSAS